MKNHLLKNPALALAAVSSWLSIACAVPLAAGTLFLEDFETPDVSGYEQGVTPPDIWVRAANGYGSGDHGMVDKDSGDFAAPVGNDQAYALSYTNSGITTAEGVLGPPLAAGGAYQVSFDVVKNGVTAGRSYTVRLIAFAADAPRDDCRSTPTGSTVLASATGSAPDNGSFATVTFNYNTSGTTNLGKDLGIRVIGSGTSAIIDNIRFRTIPSAASGLNLVTTTPLDNEPEALTYVPLLAVFDKNIAAGSGNITLHNLTDLTAEIISITDPRVTISGTLLRIEDSTLLQWGKNYAVRIAPGAVVEAPPGSASYPGIANETTWNFSTAVGDPLLYSVARLKEYILGNITLTAAEIDAIKLDLDDVAPRFAESAETISALLDLVSTYDTSGITGRKGPLWIASFLPKRDSVTNDLHWTMFNVMQNIMGRIYTSQTMAAHEDLLDGFKFGSSSNFPGACAPPANPANTHTATISASYLDTFGRPTLSDGRFTFARKPTGTYLAPGTIATVTVPPSMVNTGYRIRVGCHSSDFGNKPDIKRLDRVTRTYEITSLQTKVANPLGGGIYIEIPWLANAGVVNVDITGAVRSPYFSAKSFHTTTAEDWENIERSNPGPWADFQTDKFMMQVPKSWISSMTGAQTVQLMIDWDKAMDAMHDLLGLPRIRGKESLYPQVDLLLKNSVYAPGYPSVNTTYSPTGNYGGYAGSHLVRGPQNAPYYEFHELGHGFLFPKFPGENESNVNLLHVAVMNRAFGKSLDEGHRSSMGGDNLYQTLDTTAMAWMCVFNFSPREQPMNSLEKQYQLKGHAKFVDIAKLYGWEKLDAFWYGMQLDDENNIAYTTSVDALLLRLCKAVGKDIRPLFHFWGIHPQSPATLAASIAAANIPPDPDIKARLLHYRSLVPANNAEFRTFATSWWGRKPLITGAWEETDHAMQWDETPDADGGSANANVRPNGDIYVEASAASIQARVDELVELYFPSVLDTGPMSFAVKPTAINATTIGMTAKTATSSNGPIEYLFKNITNNSDSGWISSPSWSQTGLTTGVTYSFQVMAKDSVAQTAWSDPESATPAADVTPPAPDPMAFATPPAALDISSIIMTAAVATDINGVEYYFQCTAGGGPDSDWQSSRDFTATGLEPTTAYTYVVRARDSAGNTTGNSAPVSATTLTPDTTGPAIVSLSPADNAIDVPVTNNMVATFDENIAVGSGNITIRNLTDGTDVVIAVTDATQVSVSGATLTINPTVSFLSGKAYAIRIDETAIDDLAGNSYAGITDDTTWNFNSAVVPYVWTQTAGGAQAWTTDGNWQGGLAPSPIAGDTIDFSTANIISNTTLTFGADRSAQIWKFGDATTASHDWIVNAGNQMILAGITPTINVVNRTATLNNVVAGTSGLTKTGAGTLILNGNNTFTGGLNISAGSIQMGDGSNANALGASSNVFTFTGNASLHNSNGTITITQEIAVNDGVVGTLSGAFDEDTIVSGPVTGSGELRIGAGSNGFDAFLNSTANTHTGTLWVTSQAFNTTLSLNSLADGSGLLKMGNGTASASLTLGGSLPAPVILNSRVIQLSGTTGAVSINNNASNTARTLTINTNLSVTGTGTKSFTLGGSNTGANTFAGNIVNGSGTIALAKSGGGKWILSGSNTYTGATTISAGTLSINTLGDVSGGASSLGNPGTAANGKILIGSANSTGTLLYTGPAASTDRTIQINSSDNTNTGGAVITNDGSGALTFTATTFNNPYTLGGTVTRLLTLGGSNGGTIQGVIQDNSATGKVALAKSGDGTWLLSGNNTYTGTTTVSAGKLFINGDQAAANAAVSVSANATLGGTGTIGGSTTIAPNGKLEFNLGTNTGSHDKLELAAGKSLIFSGASTLTLTSSGGSLPGDYTLVTAPGGFGTSVPPATVNLPSGWTADAPRFVGTDLKINITSTGVDAPGPVASFAISPIASPQTIGTPITGITITAKDSLNATVTDFTGTVTFGGTGGFTGTSASFIEGALTGFSVTPTVAGSNLTLTVSDGANPTPHTGSSVIATINPVASAYETWTVNGAAFDADANGDGVKNGMAFLLGAAGPNAPVAPPTVTQSGGNLVLTFDCLEGSKRGSAALHVQHSGNPGISNEWTSSAVPGVVGEPVIINNVHFATSANGDLIHVVATIPQSAAVSGKLFGRLQATP